MDVALLLILPTIGGYLLAHTWNFTKFRSSREEGHRLYFRAAFYGAVLFVISWSGTQYLRFASTPYAAFETSVITHIKPLLKKPVASDALTAEHDSAQQAQIALTALYALLFGALVGYPLNILFRTRYHLRKAVADNDLERLIQQAALRVMPVCICMDNGKVYVGFITRTIDPTQIRKFIAILPLMSGYRDTQGKLRFTTFYATVYEEIAKKKSKLAHLSPNDFEKVLPTDKVDSINMFDLEAYETFQKNSSSSKKNTKHTVRTST